MKNLREVIGHNRDGDDLEADVSAWLEPIAPQTYSSVTLPADPVRY